MVRPISLAFLHAWMHTWGMVLLRAGVMPVMWKLLAPAKMASQSKSS